MDTKINNGTTTEPQRKPNKRAAPSSSSFSSLSSLAAEEDQDSIQKKKKPRIDKDQAPTKKDDIKDKTKDKTKDKKVIEIEVDVHGKKLPPGVRWVRGLVPEADELWDELQDNPSMPFEGLATRGKKMLRKKAPFVGKPVELNRIVDGRVQLATSVKCIPGYRFPGFQFRNGSHPPYIDKKESPSTLVKVWDRLSAKANQGLCTEYDNGDAGIPPHSDAYVDLKPTGDLVDLILGPNAKRPFIYETIKRTVTVDLSDSSSTSSDSDSDDDLADTKNNNNNKSKKKNNKKKKDESKTTIKREVIDSWELHPEHGDVIIISAAANLAGEHSVPKVTKTKWPNLGKRISIVFRSVFLLFLHLLTVFVLFI